MKKSAQINVDLNNDDKDEGIGDWITITSLDDLFKHDTNIDFKKLDYEPLKINQDRRNYTVLVCVMLCSEVVSNEVVLLK